MFKSDPEFELELDTPLKIESKPLLKESLPPTIKPGATASVEMPPVVNRQKEAEKPVEAISEESADEFFLDLDEPEDSPVRIINNRYQITEQISSDEEAVVYLAEDKTIPGKKVVVRELINETEDSFANKIFAEERTSLTQINHQNIANALDSGKLPDGKSYLVFEYVEGQTVKDYLEKTGQFNALRTARIVRQAADALSEAHQNGIMHRNLKPENIVLTVDESGMERVKLTNFGASKERLNEKNLVYKSPELVEGKVANFTSDAYSLAVIAYQMLTNRLPFNASAVGDLLKAQREGLKIRPGDLRADLPPAVDAVLKKALSFNPFDRFEKVRDFGDEFFSEIIANAPLEADEESKKPRRD
jgi:serine/threonine-protein kinase